MSRRHGKHKTGHKKVAAITYTYTLIKLCFFSNRLLNNLADLVGFRVNKNLLMFLI